MPCKKQFLAFLFMLSSSLGMATGVDTLAIQDSIMAIQKILRLHPDKALQKYEQLKQVCTFIDFKKGLSDIHQGRAFVAVLKNDWDTAKKELQISLKYAEEINYTSLMVRSRLNLAWLTSMSGQYYEASILVKEAFYVAEHEKNNELLAKSCFVLGNIYRDLKQYKQALEVYKEGRRYAKKASDAYMQVVNTAEAAILLARQGEMELALENINNSKNLYEQNKSLFVPGIFDLFMAKVWRPENPDMSFKYAEKALKTMNDKAFAWHTFSAYELCARAAIEKGNAGLAKSFLVKLEKNQKDFHPMFRVDYLRTYAAYYALTGNFIQALQMEQKAHVLEDENLSGWYESNMEEVLSETEALIEKNTYLQNKVTLESQQHELYRSWLYVLYGGGAIVIITMLVFRRMYLNQEKKKKHYRYTLQEKNRELETAISQKKELIDSISHELRTPLYTMSLIMDVLLKNKNKKEEEYLLAAYGLSNKHLAHFIDNMLAINESIQRGSYKQAEEVMDLRKLLKDIIRPFKLLGSNNRFEIDVDERIPRQLLGDVPKLSQVLYNLVDNANKYTQSGKIKLEVEAVNMKASKIALYFKVQDNGQGISKENLKRIFQAFNNIDNNPRHQGVGIGLNVVRKLLHLQGSEIKIDSKVGQGSTFHFYLWLGIPSVSLTKESKSAINIRTS